MLTKIRNSKWAKVVAIVILFSFLSEIIQPNQLFAITGGPSQPEMAGFTPVSTDQMVDLFSGDFHYTIPIMVVPGPNGGFPINLNYNSNVGMEQEATWVGLGWTLNPGAINRQVRGVPDDFCGDEIEKFYHRRDNNTFLFTPGGGGEVFGANFGVGLSGSSSVIYNTYSGISLCQRFGISASYVRDRKIEGDGNKLRTSAAVGFNVNLDSDNGITTSFSMNGGSKNLKAGFNYGYNSKSGTYTFSNQISLNFASKVNQKEGQESSSNKRKYRYFGGSVGSSFSTAANLPPIHLPLSSTSWGLSFQIGGAGAYLEGYGSINSTVINQVTPDKSIFNKACGIIYANHTDKFTLQDFNREKELCVDKDSRNLPLPVMTHDLYSISGEQMGGTFRAYRSDYGHFYDNEIKNSTFTGDAGVDLASGDGWQLGVNLSFSEGETVSGDWDPEDFDEMLTYKDKMEYSMRPHRSIPPTLYEPFYFKMTGEKTASFPNTMQNIGNEEAVNFKINKSLTHSFFGGLDNKYIISDSLSDGTVITSYEQGNRTKRATSIEYGFNGRGEHRKNHHIASFSILNENGERFTYGKTLYNYIEKEVSFSILSDSTRIDSTVIMGYSPTYAYQSTPDRLRVGKERLFSSTTTPAFPYSYLLTSITSPDYIDLTGNGPSDDDFGYWVKFDYGMAHSGDTAYCWRFPYEGANYFMGDQSNQNDDIGSYHFGKKEIAYIDTISTKTHYAVFYKSVREDAYGANPGDEEMGGYWEDNSQKLYKLDSIKLFSRESPDVAIKTAIFEYDYSLCRGVPNTSNTSMGKLTLKRLYFKYADNVKGEQNPYVFTYSGFNPSYAPEKMDRWGQYKGDANYFEHYATQNADSANRWATAWLLTRIDLPEGGSIEIEYESDDYAYVQDRQAMYMAEVHPQTTFRKEDGHYYIYFRKRQGTRAAEYVSDIKYDLMFFKIAISYKNGMLPDYIQGYTKVLSTTDFSDTIGKIEVESFPAYDIHPVYFFALQYLKNNRPDLLFDGADELENSGDAAGFFSALVSGGMIDKANAMFGNDLFYQHCVKNNDYAYLQLDRQGMPSYVRLNVPDKIKYGGGSRVRAITIQDNWSKSDSSAYRQEYFYRKTENGNVISSGVAEYEPTVGAEENAMRYPVYDEDEKMFFVEDEMYSEEPYGESYFPAANVGYSQVIVKTSTPSGVTLSNTGIQRHEFYTAKDFPIIVSQTILEVDYEKVPNLLSMLTAGFKQTSSSCYSQGYLIELNDMHGKQKSVSTCPYVPELDASFLIPAVERMGYTSKVEYLYQTDTHSPVPKLDNNVEVLTADGKSVKMLLGQTYDFVIDQRCNHSKNIGGGVAVQFMLGNWYPPLAGGSVMPSFDCFEEDVKSVATTKIIYRSGILRSTKAYNNGSVITTTNLKYDPYTGNPLLTTVTNELEQPVYNYSMPAYWYYSNMGSAADNYRAIFYGNTILPNGEPAFGQFDRVPCNNNNAPIKTVNNNYAVCWTPTDSTNVYLWGNEILKSRRSNQINIMAGQISSLTNPADPKNRYLPVLDQFKSKKDTCFRYTDCSGDSSKWVRISYLPQNRKLYFFITESLNEKLCNNSIDQLINENSVSYLVYNVDINPQYFSDLCNCHFSYNGHHVNICRNADSIVIASFIWNDPNGYFTECLDGVLQTSSTEYRSTWDYDYWDAGTSFSSGEQYLGIPNIYRSLRQNLYVTERNQSANNGSYLTNIANDGTFSSFSFFNYARGNSENLQNPWTWTAEMTKYSPFNFEIENINALGIYSSALYGYRNSLATAVANNARYDEIAFDSFENDTNISVGNQRGHLLIQNNGARVSALFAHSGNKSLKASSLIIDLGSSSHLKLQNGKKYVFSCWVRKDDCGTLGNLGEDYIFTYNGVSVNVSKEPKVECWQRVEIEFTYNGANTLTLAPQDASAIYVDDVRIMPAQSTFKSYVYDPHDYKLIAELDENNYAVFYNYDEEGVLVQIKKETEKGIMTIQTTRQNLKVNRNNP